MPTLAEMGFDDQQQEAIVGAYDLKKKTEDRALEMHRERAEQLQVAQSQAGEKQRDIDFVRQFDLMLNPQVPKAARGQLYKEIARGLNIDPASQSAKELGTVLQGLDPANGQLLKAMMVEQLQNASPGTVRKMAAGILNGQIPLSAVVQQANAAGLRMGAEAVAEAQRAFPEQSSAAAPAQKPAGQQQAQAQPGMVPRNAAETLPPRFREIDTGLAQSFGVPIVDPAGNSIRYSAEDFRRAGFKVPENPADQVKLSQEVDRTNSGLVNLSTAAASVIGAFRGRPELLGATGWGIRTLDAGVNQGLGILNATIPGFQDQTTREGTENIAKSFGQRIQRLYASTGLALSAEQSAEIQSAVIGLAYLSLAAKGIEGQRLTNAHIARELQQLGNSGSPQQFEAALSNFVQRGMSQSIRRMQQQAGPAWRPDLSSATRADLETLGAAADVLPEDVRRQAEALWDARYGQPAQPAAGGAPGGAGQPQQQRPNQEPEQPAQPAAPKAQQGAQVKPSGTVERAEQSQAAELQRQRSMQEEQQGFLRNRESREQAGEQRAQRDQELQEAAFAYRISRDKKEDAEKQQAKLQAAFAAFARALGGTEAASVRVGSGSGGGGGGDQNPAAFRYPERKTRAQQPEPVRARRR